MALDLEAWLEAVPEEATIKGMFLQPIVEAMGSKRHPFDDHYSDLRSYPASEFIRLAAHAAAVVYPDRTIGDGVREFGKLAFPRFAEALIGKVILRAAGRDPARILSSAPKAYAVVGKPVAATFEVIDSRYVIVRLRSCWDLAQFHEVGVMEGMLDALDLEGTVEATVHGLADVDLHVRWVG